MTCQDALISQANVGLKHWTASNGLVYTSQTLYSPVQLHKIILPLFWESHAVCYYYISHKRIGVRKPAVGALVKSDLSECKGWHKLKVCQQKFVSNDVKRCQLKAAKVHVGSQTKTPCLHKSKGCLQRCKAEMPVQGLEKNLGSLPRLVCNFLFVVTDV